MTREQYLRSEDVAEMLQISKPHVQRLTKAGVIPSIKLGHKLIRYERVAIENAMRKLRQAA